MLVIYQESLQKIVQIINGQNEIRYNGPFGVLIDQSNKRNRYALHTIWFQQTKKA